MLLTHDAPLLGVAQSWCLALVAAIGFVGGGVWWQLDRARLAHPDDAVDGVRCVMRILVLFFLVTPFWSLFDQKASTWVLQANAMTKPSWFEASQMQALNPLLVMLLIPFNNLVLYPALRRVGFEPTALRRMGAGIAFSGLSWVVVGAMQLALDDGQALSILWQILPYALLTIGEVWVSATGLEFAYSQAPAAMKSAIMAFWSLSVTVGNLWVLLVNAAVRNDAVTQTIERSGLGVVSFQMFFFAAFAFLAAGIRTVRGPVHAGGALSQSGMKEQNSLLTLRTYCRLRKRQTEGVRVFEVKVTTPIPYPAHHASQALPVQLVPSGVSVDVSSLTSDQEVVVSYLWRPNIRVHADGIPAPAAWGPCFRPRIRSSSGASR
jgi:hypothetical protein